jgi:aldehyde:ferredoxin oxidoreductase
MDKIIRVNLKTRKINIYNDEEFKYYWGRGFIAAFLNKEVDPRCEPLGSINKLIITRGPLGGTQVPCSGRLSIGGKSPLTGGIKESNAGGTMGHHLGKLGIKAIIIEETPQDGGPYILYVSNDNIYLEEASELKQKNTSQTMGILQGKYGNKISAAVIGPAGEMGLLASGIAVTDKEGRPSRYAGRGGLGAVMGSKRLKAIVVNDKDTTLQKPANEEDFQTLNKKLITLLKEHPQTSQIYTRYSTAAALSLVNEFGALPTRNFRYGRFKHASKINGDALHDTILARGGAGSISHSCMPGCPIKCSNVFADRDGNEIVAPLEYETLGLIGSNLCIDNFDDIAIINAKLNELGLDTIETGAALGLLMEAGVIQFSDSNGVLSLLEEVERATVLGRVVGSGALLVGKVMGLARIPVVKGQAIPAYDPRGIKANGVLYATSPMGADHTAGNALRAPVNHLDPKGQAKIAEVNQINMTAVDCLGLCMMIVPALGGDFGIIVDLINAMHGWHIQSDFISKMGKKVLKLERKFNHNAGLNLVEKLPEFLYREPLEPHNSVFDVDDAEIKEVLNYIK